MPPSIAWWPRCRYGLPTETAETAPLIGDKLVGNLSCPASPAAAQA